MCRHDATIERDASGARAAFALFERQVLVFPLLVVLLACVSFLFGGRCAAWQWWTAVAAVTFIPSACRDNMNAFARNGICNVSH